MVHAINSHVLASTNHHLSAVTIQPFTKVYTCCGPLTKMMSSVVTVIEMNTIKCDGIDVYKS